MIMLFLPGNAPSLDCFANTAQVAFCTQTNRMPKMFHSHLVSDLLLFLVSDMSFPTLKNSI